MTHYDLLIVGTGSGNSVITPELDDWQVAIVEKGVFGGTCLNVGCIPSKMFVYAAELAELARHGPDLGVHTRVDGVDWPTIRDRVFGRIDPIAAGGETYRVDGCDNVTVYRGEGHFVGNKKLIANDEQLTADHVVLAAGARVFVPEVPGLAESGFHTSDTIMRIDALPEQLLIIGGGYIAAELGHVFSGLGSKVTIVNRSDTLLRHEDDDIRLRFTEMYRRRMELLLSTQLLEVRREDDAVEIDVSVDGDHTTRRGDALLVATGRVPNSDRLGLDALGVDVDHAGYVVTDEFMRTGVEGVWALGDITNPDQLKHTANAEARAVAHNLAHPDDLQPVDLSFTPHAVFGHPQVASVGMTERDAHAQGISYHCKIQHYSDTAYGWAMEDTQSFVKLIADTHSRLLLGAHIIGPQASTLIQQLIQGMRFGQTVDEMASGQLYIHPALSEVVENALLGL
ncbi:MAG: mycothione reductase [Acidimicrobiia bacterium]|nr:mycothione reductase [Acidimicrobiia bacterium]